MGKWSEEPIGVGYFTDVMIRSEDLDPVYCCLVDADLPDDQLKRMLLAYWCFYSVGTAARIVEPGPDYFYTMMMKAHHEKWPHGFERRYFYGDLAFKTITQLEEFGSPERVVDHMTRHQTFHAANKAVLSHYGFGPWMGWKVADMADRVLGIDVDFTDCSLGVYKDPAIGAGLLLTGKLEQAAPDDVQRCCDILDAAFADYEAPPFYDRAFNIQEGETVLCKYKAYFKGQYYVGKDVKEVSEGLEHAMGEGCELAAHILDQMPPEFTETGSPWGQEIDGLHECVWGQDYPMSCSSAEGG